MLNESFFESTNLRNQEGNFSHLQREPFSTTKSYLVYIVEMQLMELADGYITTYSNHGPGNSTREMGTIAPKFCYRNLKFRPWYFSYEFWNVVNWRYVYSLMPEFTKNPIRESGIVK